MKRQNLYPFNSISINSFTPGQASGSAEEGKAADRDIVYHYTSPDAFLSIIKNKGIRFTDIRYLNDKSEGIYFVKLLLDFISKNPGVYPSFEEAVNQLLKHNDTEKIRNLEVTEVRYAEIPYLPYKATRVFVFCACTEADSLNMWNYYVNNGAYQGYNIGFRITELLKTFDTPDPKMADAFLVYYGNVLYDEKKQLAEIRKFAEGIEMGILSASDKARAMKYAQLTIRSYINSQGAFYKHPKFRSENEFRILLEIADDRIPHSREEASKFAGVHNRMLTEDFCTKRGLIVPFLAVALPDNVISRVTAAPMVEFDIAKQSIQELFAISGIKNASIHRSGVPIRF